MSLLNDIQTSLENFYGIKTNLDISHFVYPKPAIDGAGKLVVHQSNVNGDIDLAVLFDRDLLNAWHNYKTADCKKGLSVLSEECSHFVYLSYNHNRNRNVTQLEMEIQGEIDRILVAFHSGIVTNPTVANEIKNEFLLKPYEDNYYEESRKVAVNFYQRRLPQDPSVWQEKEFFQLRKFFHSDLSEKLHLSKIK